MKKIFQVKDFSGLCFEFDKESDALVALAFLKIENECNVFLDEHEIFETFSEFEKYFGELAKEIALDKLTKSEKKMLGLI